MESGVLLEYVNEMARQRKTAAQRRQEFADAERREWQDFRERVNACRSFVDAQLLVARPPRPDSPGRRFYMNLGFFLNAFDIPVVRMRKSVRFI